MSEPVIVLHRPPRPRIDLGLKPRSPEPEAISEATRALQELGARIANERIWDLLKRSAEGCNPGSTEQ